MGLLAGNILMETSPLLEIDGVTAMIVHLDKADSAYVEHMDIQMPGYHVLNRIGFEDVEDIREVTELIDAYLDTLWDEAAELTDAVL